MKVQNKDRYKEGSWCARCEHLTPERSNTIWDFAIAYLPNPWQDKHPEIKPGKVYYDEKGWKHTILARLVITHFDRRKRVFCELCGKQCRAGSFSKTPTKNHYEPSLRGPKKGRPKESITYESEKNPILDFFNRIGRTGNKKSVFRKIISIMKHLEERGFTLSDNGRERYLGYSGIIDTADFWKYYIINFDMVIIHLDLLNDEKKRQHLIKWSTMELLSFLKDKEFNQELVDLGIKITKNDILRGIKLGEDTRLERETYSIT